MTQATAIDRTGAAATRLTEPLAEWVSGLAPGELPATTRHAVRLFILDTLGAALYGRNRPWAQAVRGWAARGAVRPGEGAPASAWGEAPPDLRPSDAALVNGTAAHAFELDDFHKSKIHPGAVVVPAAIALGEAVDASGAALETAIAAGYEVMIRTSLALNPGAARLRGWHLTGITGPLGAAAAGAVLLGLDARATAWALGLGGTQGAGLFAFIADGAMSKRLHAGLAAQSGVLAAEFAALGITGPTQVYEAEDGGYLQAFSDNIRPDRLLDGLGVHFHLDDTVFKPHACCGSLHAYVDAALQLRARNGGPPAAGRRVRAGMSHLVDLQCGFDYNPGTELNGQMSARYCVAAALVDGAVLPPQFAPQKLADTEIVELARRIELVPDSELDRVYPERFSGWVEIEDAAGGFERADIASPSGSSTNAGRDAALLAKFRALAGASLGGDAETSTEALTLNLDATSTRELARSLAGGAADADGSGSLGA